MDSRARSLALPALVLLLAACGGDPEAPQSAAATEAAEGAAPLPGAAEPMGMEPYQSPPGFPLPFRTVVPQGFRPEPEMEDRGAAVRFTWVPAGERRDSAFVYVRVMDEGTSEGRGREIVRTAAERLRIPGDRSELEPRERHPWAVVEYPLRSVGTSGEPLRGWVALGRRGSRWFYVIAQAQTEEWPRFHPGAELLLSEWRWVGPDGRPETEGL